MIPVEVIETYFSCAVNAKRRELLWIAGLDHQIHPWLRKRTNDLNKVLAIIDDFIAEAI